MKLNFKELFRNRKLIFEFLSITFAVFLGLMMNQWKDNRNHQKLAVQTKSNILAEVTNNHALVDSMLFDHRDVLREVDSIISLQDSADVSVELYLNISFELLSSAAWETAKLSQAIGYMDMDIVSDIAGVYDFQGYYESIVKDYIRRNLSIRPQANDLDFLQKSKNFIESIIPLEYGLTTYYTQLEEEVLGN